MEQSAILRRIRETRRRRGWSQSEMADRLNIALKTYQNLESGITRIDIERLAQVAATLDVELVSLLGYPVPPEPGMDRFSEEKALYNKIIQDKEAYIRRLEESLKIYQDILKRDADDADSSVR